MIFDFWLFRSMPSSWCENCAVLECILQFQRLFNLLVLPFSKSFRYGLSFFSSCSVLHHRPWRHRDIPFKTDSRVMMKFSINLFINKPFVIWSTSACVRSTVFLLSAINAFPSCNSSTKHESEMEQHKKKLFIKVFFFNCCSQFSAIAAGIR